MSISYKFCLVNWKKTSTRMLPPLWIMGSLTLLQVEFFLSYHFKCEQYHHFMVSHKKAACLSLTLKKSWSGAPCNCVMCTTTRLVISHHLHCWINNECSYPTNFKIILLLYFSSCWSSHVVFANEIMHSLHFDVKCIQARRLMDQHRACEL